MISHKVVGEIFLWYKYLCYINDTSRNYLVRYFCDTSNTCNTSVTSDTSNTANSSDASKTSTSVTPDFRIIFAGKARS